MERHGGAGQYYPLKTRSVKMKNTTKILMGIFAVLFVAACGAKDVKPTVLSNGCPAWTFQGTAAFNDGNLYGVGQVAGVQNPALANNAADARARTNLARSLSTKVTSLLKDYQSSTTAGDFGASSEEQDITEATKTFTELNLNGAVIVDRCKGTDGVLYSLAKMDLTPVNNIIDQQKQLSPKIKAIVKENAAKAFDELNAEASK